MSIYSDLIYIEELYSEIERLLSPYKHTGHVTRDNVITFTLDGLKIFGNNITEKYDEVISIYNSRGMLPKNLYRINRMFKCRECDKSDYKKYHIDGCEISEPYRQDSPCKPKPCPTVQRVFKWVETNKHVDTYNLCDECDKDIYSVVSTQIEYFPQFKKPCRYIGCKQELKFSKATTRGMCTKKCFDDCNPDSPYEVGISGSQVLTSFKEGSIFINYNGIPIDDDGNPMIKNSNKGYLLEYIRYYVIYHILEYIRIRDASASQLYFDYFNLANSTRNRALSDAKNSNFSNSTYLRLISQNRNNTEQYMLDHPSDPLYIKRIDRRKIGI